MIRFAVSYAKLHSLRSATASLANKQGKRIYSHYILGMSKSDIARAEGANEKAVRVDIKKGLIKAITFEKVLDVFAD